MMTGSKPRLEPQYPRPNLTPAAGHQWTEFLSTARLMPMSTIGAAQFKQECLAILDRLGPEGIVITKHGKPVAKLVPIETESSSLIGSLAGKIRVNGDLLTTGLRWDAES
jgi:prevent-host-death family protein